MSLLVLAACATGPSESVTTDERATTDPGVATDPAASTDPPATGGENGGHRTEPKDVVTRVVDEGDTGVLPDGFGSVTATITAADGEVCEVCLWLADTEELRSRGLMGVTDLGDAVGMAFRWEQPVTSRFFMFQTPTPLSIAWFSASGAHAGQADMDPCLVDDSSTCERYEADDPYTIAIEMFGGQLDTVGIGPGATVVLEDVPCA